MKRLGIVLATVFGAALMVSGPALADEVNCLYNGGLHRCVWYPGYAYENGNPYGNGNGIGGGLAAIVTAPLTLAADVTAPLTAPLMTGRSVAVSGVAGSGNYCATSIKTCLLDEPGWLGTGCSCKVHGGHARGFVQ